MEFGIIGTSIWQQNMQLLERLTIDREARVETLKSLKEAMGLDELIYLSTCNRVEFIYVSSGRYIGAKILHRMIDFFFKDQAAVGFFPNDFYHFTGREAVSHLFRTTAALESLVVGEAQIAGQFKEAYMEALATGLAGAVLKDLSEEALLVAKKVKRDTSVGSGSVSMASLAADELAAHLAAADDSTIALVGAGPMTVKIARYIADHKLGKMIFVNRTTEKAVQLAEQFSGLAVSLSEFLSAPPRIDAMVSATAATEPIFQLDFLTRLPSNNRPILCVDLAIPRDFALCFNKDPRVTVVDIPYLRSRCSTNLRQKFIETSKANEIVRQSVSEYLCDRIEGTLKPIFHDSYQESMNLARRALDDLFAKKVTSLNADEKDAIYRLVGKLIANSAFQPVKALSGKLSQLGDELSLSDLSQSKQAI